MMNGAFAYLMQVGTLPNAAAQLMPLVIAALLLDASVVAIWYYLGVLINKPEVKGSAKGEFYQFIGTAIMIGIIIGTLAMLSSTYYSILGITKLMSPSAISTMCTNIESSSPLDLIGSTNSLLSGPVSSSGTATFPGLCSLVSQSGSSASLTNKLDYPLAATAVVVSNLTNQTVNNYNASFTLDAWFGFLSRLRPEIGICFDEPPLAQGCLIPSVSPIFKMLLSFAPYSGFSMLIGDMSTLGSLLGLSTAFFIGQLILISIFLYIWPYLLFVGFVLRSTFFTRKLGGLLIAVAIAGLLVYPAVFAFEYTTLGNGVPFNPNNVNATGLNSTYGFSANTALPGPLSTTGTSVPGNYVTNFFVEPSIQGIATYYGCWPSSPKLGIHGLFGSEALDIGYLLLPAAGIISSIKYAFGFALGSSTPSFFMPANCAPSSALSTFFDLLNAYGIIGIASYLIPVLNLIITVSSIIGLSALFGGDTSLAGLAKIL